MTFQNKFFNDLDQFATAHFRIHQMKPFKQSILVSIVILELVSYYKYEYYPKSKKIIFSLFPIIFYYCYSTYNLKAFIKLIFLFLIYLVEISEAISYYTTKTTFSLEFFNSINIADAFTTLRPISIKLCCLAAALLILVILNIAFPPYLIRFRVVNISNLLIVLLLYIKFAYIYNEIFAAFRDNSFQSTDRLYRLIKYITRKPKIWAQKPRKNLLLFTIESFELQNLGPFNHHNKNLMPFLSNVALNSTIFTNAKPQPLIHTSISSFFCVVCGFPVIYTPNVKLVGQQQGEIQLSPKFKCIPDILHSLNYSNYLIITGYHNWGNLNDFSALHNYTVLTSKAHGKILDIDVMKWTTSELIPKLKKQQPFFLTIHNFDTHNGRMPNSCMKKSKSSGRQKFFNEFDCLDQYIHQLFITLKENDLYDNTEIIIYGDHFFMGPNYFVDPRTEAIILPKHKYGNITKPITYYDMTHLMLHLMNITISVPFPFGSDPLSPNYRFSPPTSEDLKVLPSLYFKFIQVKGKKY